MRTCPTTSRCTCTASPPGNANRKRGRAMKMDCATDLRPQTQSLASRYAGQTVLAIGAHPDDLEIGIGGTLAKLQRAGSHVVMVVASIPKDYEVRLAGAKRGAEILGGELRFLVEDGPRRIEGLKKCDLVGLLD